MLSTPPTYIPISAVSSSATYVGLPLSTTTNYVIVVMDFNVVISVANTRFSIVGGCVPPNAGGASIINTASTIPYMGITWPAAPGCVVNILKVA